MSDTDRAGAGRAAGAEVHAAQAAADRGDRLDRLERLGRIAEAARVVLWEVRLPDFVFTEISPAAETIFGYPLARWFEPGFFENILHPEDRAWVLAFCLAQTEAGRDHDFEYRAVRADGSIARIRDIVTVVDPLPGGERLVRGALVDVTERHTALEAERDRALTEAAAQSRAYASAAHDLRTPLNGILGTVALMRAGGSADTAFERCLDVIEEAGRTMLELIAAEVETGGDGTAPPQQDCRDIDLRALVGSAAGLVRPLAADRGLALEVSVGEEVPQTVHLDPVPLKRTLLNLLGNAVKYTEAGSVTLSVSAVGPLVHLVIEDTGPGIDVTAADAAVLRGARQAADGGEMPAGRRVSLGLGIVGRAVATLGGTVRFATTPTGGTRVTVDLPADARSEACTVREHAPAPSLRVLCAEDDPTNAQVLREMLRLRAIEAEIVGTGIEALERLERDRFDFVFMDLHMPGLDGIETTRRLRAFETGTAGAGARLPVVGVTADPRPANLRACREAGMDAMLAKPVRLAELFETLDRLAPRPGGKAN